MPKIRLNQKVEKKSERGKWVIALLLWVTVLAMGAQVYNPGDLGAFSGFVPGSFFQIAANNTAAAGTTNTFDTAIGADGSYTGVLATVDYVDASSTPLSPWTNDVNGAGYDFDGASNITVVTSIKAGGSITADTNLTRSAASAFLLGDGDTGMRENGADDTIRLFLGGSGGFRDIIIRDGDFESERPSGFWILKQTYGSTDPVYTVNGDTDTGFGFDGANKAYVGTGNAQRQCWTNDLSTMLVPLQHDNQYCEMYLTDSDTQSFTGGTPEAITNWTVSRCDASYGTDEANGVMTNAAAGWFELFMAKSFSTGAAEDMTCRWETNGVAIPSSGWERDTGASLNKGVVAWKRMIQLPAGCTNRVTLNPASAADLTWHTGTASMERK